MLLRFAYPLLLMLAVFLAAPCHAEMDRWLIKNLQQRFDQSDCRAEFLALLEEKAS